MTTKTTTKCYITGKDYPTQYYFGTEAHVVLSLAQDAFAHFILRAGKDVVHNQIIKDIKQVCDDIEAFEKEYPTKPADVDSYIDASISLNILVDRRNALLTQKCESGIRILRQIKADFQRTGKLSS